MDTSKCIHPVFINNLGYVPCGSCPVCRMKYRKQMAARILMEQNIEKPVYSYFITLTYDESNIPTVNGRHCFSKEHVTTFLDSVKHRLSRDGYTYRHFLTCEYGEEGYRPHYHCLFFLYRKSGDISCVSYPRLTPGLLPPHFFFNESIIQPLWHYGFTSQGTVTSASVLYCTSYALKDEEYMLDDWKGFEEGKPFRRYSLRPGLGLTDKCLAWWLDYIRNDGQDIRSGFKIHTSRGCLSTGIPVGIKRRLESYPDIKELLTAKNCQALDDMQEDLSFNSQEYGSKMVYLNGKKFKSENFSESPDREIMAFRKALRKINKSSNHL